MLTARGLTKNGRPVFGPHIPIDVDAVDTDPETIQLTCILLRREEFDAMLDALCLPADTVQHDLATWQTAEERTGALHTFTGCLQTGHITQEGDTPLVSVELRIALTALPPAPGRSRRRRWRAS